MLELNKLETVAALCAVRAVIDSRSGVPASNPLATVEKKLDDHLKEFDEETAELLLKENKGAAAQG